MSSKSAKVNSVLARFEETIEKNNAVGVCSGMYLTTQVGTNKCRPSGRRHSSLGGAVTAEPSMRRRASVAVPPNSIKPGMYRDMVNGHKGGDEESVSSEGHSDEWDPFSQKDADDESFSSQHDDDGSMGSDQHRIKLQRPRTQKSAGRRATRKTRTKGSAAPRKSTPKDLASVDTCTTKGESENEDMDGFAVTYLGNRDKFTDLQRQNSDKRLHRQGSRSHLMRGLEMTRQDSASSLNSQNSRKAARKIEKISKLASSGNLVGGESHRPSRKHGSDIKRGSSSREHVDREPVRSPTKRSSSRSMRSKEEDLDRVRTRSRHTPQTSDIAEEGEGENSSPQGRSQRSMRKFKSRRDQ